MSRRRPPLLTGMVLVVALVVGLPAAALAAFTAVGSQHRPGDRGHLPGTGRTYRAGHADRRQPRLGRRLS